MLSVVLIIAGFFAIVLSIPQLIQIIKMKNADEFSLLSWLVWLIYQSVALIYTIKIGAHAYTAINAAWVTFYLFTILLIIKYRKPKAKT